MIGSLSSQFTAPQDHLGNLVLTHKMLGHLQAIELEQIADFARSTNEVFPHLEIAALLHISDRAAERRIAFALAMTSRLPNTLATLRDGHIEEFKAQLIAEAIEPLTDEHALAVEARVLDKASWQTPQQLRNTLAKTVLAVDPQGAEMRRKEKILGRRVESRPTEDGMAMLTLHHKAEVIATTHGLITARARELKSLGDEPRTLAQLEADIAADLLQGTDSGGRTIEVHLTIPATTATGIADEPGEVDGLPITAQAARDLAKDASTWRWLRTDATTGQVVDLTSPRYTPPESLAAYVKVRDRTCRFPGCTRRARVCDVDHRTPWPHGATAATNCQCLCRRHHKAKHEAGWEVTEIKPGWLEWTSPMGLTHLVPPEPAAQPPPVIDDPPPF